MRLLIGIIFICQTFCTAQSPLETVLLKIEGADSVLSDPKFQFECILTQVIRENDDTKFRRYHVGDSSSYYYPASTVKLPLALQVLHNYELSDKYQLKQTEVCENYQYDSEYHVGYLLKKMLVFSDNPSYNYLFELSGAGGMQEYMNDHDIEGQVSRRLLACKKKYWRRSNPNNLHHINYKYKGSFRHGLKAKIGHAHYYGGKFHNKPRNFKTHNYLPLQADHDLLQRLVFNHESLGISKMEKDSLIHFLSMTPGEYGDTTKEDGFTKYLFVGNDSTAIPEHITIVNIVGRAYGFLIDHAYIHDTRTNTEFILSAKIYLNNNGILGDDLYQYDTVGFPLFKSLGIETLKLLSTKED